LVSPTAAKVDNKKILRIIEEELQDLPTLPTVVLRIMQTANDPSVSAKNLKDIISSDPAFAAKVLRLVNSAAYGFPGKITTITHAIVILGFSTVRNLATSLGVGNGFGAARGPSALDLRNFWSHSVATAYAASVIGRRKNCSAKQLEEVFIGALLHDIGKLFLNRYFAEQYIVTLKFAKFGNITLLEAEKTALGIEHAMIGKQVASKWNLPAATAAMVAYHHDPSQSNEYMESVCIVHVADYLVRKLKLGNAGDDTEPVLAPEVDQWLNFLPNVWDTLEQETLAKFEGSADFLQAMLGK
jgi:putative nucleotidyltransferase with HDIG domain